MEKREMLAKRLNQLMDHYKLNSNSLAKKIGGARTKVYNAVSGKTSPHFDTIDAILETFPEVSTEWLLRGDGAMLKDEIPSLEEVQQLKSENKALQGLYERVAAQKQRLEGKSKGANNSPGVNMKQPDPQIVNIGGKRRYLLTPVRVHGSSLSQKITA